MLPKNRDAPFAAPAPSADERRGVVFDLSLAGYAYELTKGVPLDDTDGLRELRGGFPAGSPAAQPPSVGLGNVVTTNLFWAGDYLTAWARQWHDFYVQDDAVPFVSTAEEDTAVAEALDALARAGRARPSAQRLMVLRTASDYSAPPPGTDVVDWFFHSDTHFASGPAFEAAYKIGSKVVFDLIGKGKKVVGGGASAE
mmetsp:Transcript_13331/g.53477  ORF Transcript_13331/g.53477 Transcript_13331/m.53477 type:complete len:198 (+) Transcript_13331:740-1333(+)